MTAQFDRICKLTVGDPKGEALDLSELRIRFGIINGDVQTPKTASIRVYNLAPETALRIRREFTQVLLQAGYGTNVAVIFSGQVKQVRIGRENATDTYVDILAADGDTAYNQAFVSKTLGAGWTPADWRKAALDAMAPYGITAGQMAELPDVRAPRAMTIYGLARDVLRTLCETYGMTWSIVLGQLQMLPIDGVLGGSLVELTSETGLIGMPQQTIDGIMVKCLINPQIRPGARIKLNNRSIQEAAISTSETYVDKRPSTDPDGDYKVWAVAMNGDTRGNEWYMDLVCTSLDTSGPNAVPITPAFRQLRGIYGS